MGTRPTHRVSISRKDGQDITFVDYKGETQSRKYAPIGALFPSRVEGGFSIALDKRVTLDPEILWVNVYPIDMRKEDEPTGGAHKPRGGRKGGGRKAAPESPESPLFDGDGDSLPD